MNNFERVESGLEHLNTETGLKEQKLDHLETNYEQKDISFSNKNTKVMIAAGGLVNNKISNFEGNKAKIEKELSKGTNPETVLRNNSSDLNISTKQIDAQAIKGPEGMARMINSLGKGDCFVYQNSSGDLRVVFGAKMETVVVDGKETVRPFFSGYGGDGAVGDKTIRSELRNLMAEGGSLTYVTEAKTREQELVRPYDNVSSR